MILEDSGINLKDDCSLWLSNKKLKYHFDFVHWGRYKIMHCSKETVQLLIM